MELSQQHESLLILRSSSIFCGLTLTLTLFISCKSGFEKDNLLPQVTPDQACIGLFGMPNEQSGVNQDDCSLICSCGEGDRTYSQPELDSDLFTYTHINPIAPLNDDPYQNPEGFDPLQEEQVCVVKRDDQLRQYTVQSTNFKEAKPEQITHLGPCGACSSLQDLSVYMSRTDLTEPVRSCGLQGITQGMEANVDCLQALGFSESCAVIWYYNTLNTRTVCLDVCLAQLNESYLTEEGVLNDCLACDERESGPVFKRYSGRTRRNSGLASAICRPCATVARLNHSYLVD